jgi:ketol-acid reductoisomerase
MPGAILTESDADLGLIRARRIAVVGYGNQGRAHALNLRDSGCRVRVGSRPESPNRQRAMEDGFDVSDVPEACAWADTISLLMPDQYHRAVFDNSVRPALTSGKLVLVAHGFSLLYGQLQPPSDVDVALLAPVGPGAQLRKLFVAGSGIPALLALWQDVSGTAAASALSYGAALGCARIGIQETTVREETETDLFGEQAVLCGGVPALMVAGFETLVEAGYLPEIAYYECVHQLKLIVDLTYDRGIAGMREAISETARYGSFVAAPRVVDAHLKRQLRSILHDVQSGDFARRWIAEAESGSPNLRRLETEERQSLVEEVRRRIMRSAASHPPTSP